MTPAGYLKVVHIMQLEELLHDRENLGLERGNEKYWLAFFGTPSMDEPWGWRFEGHHVSLNISVAPGGGVRVTPTFFGADPAEIRVGALAGFRPHAGIEDLGRELVVVPALAEERDERADHRVFVRLFHDRARVLLLVAPAAHGRPPRAAALAGHRGPRAPGAPAAAISSGREAAARTLLIDTMRLSASPTKV